MIGTGIGAFFRPAAGGASAAMAPIELAGPADLPFTPTTRWHPAYSSVAVAGGRVISASDMNNLANVTEGAAGIGPKAMVDGAGNAFWRFEGDAFLNVAADLVCDSRDVSVFMVGRAPRHPASNNHYLGLGNHAQGSQVNTLGSALASRVVSQSAGFVQSFGKRADQASVGAEWMVPGAQLQVLGTATSASGTRLWLNERSVDVALPYNQTAISGAEIGRYPWSPGSSGNWGIFDLYEMVVFAPGLSNTDAQAVSEALMAAHDVVPVEHQLVLEGDSITQGTGSVTEALSCAAILTEPGTSHIPPNWRVINKGISGNQVSNLVTKRDTPASWSDQILSGRNVMAFEIGRNDWVAGNQTASQHYANVLAYLNSATDGILQKGWEVRAMANIAGPLGLMPTIETYRAAIRDPQFLTDTLSGSGQLFDGKVAVIATDLIAQDGATRFLGGSDASDTTYYSGDNTHPSVLGAAVRVTGGIPRNTA